MDPSMDGVYCGHVNTLPSGSGYLKKAELANATKKGAGDRLYFRRACGAAGKKVYNTRRVNLDVLKECFSNIS